jgi:hypothetical protein
MQERLLRNGNDWEHLQQVTVQKRERVLDEPELRKVLIKIAHIDVRKL